MSAAGLSSFSAAYVSVFMGFLSAFKITEKINTKPKKEKTNIEIQNLVDEF